MKKRLTDEMTRTALRIPTALYEQIIKLAHDDGRSINAELVYFLEQQVKQIEKERKG